MTRVILENVSVEFPIYGAQHLSLRNAIAQRAIGGLIERDNRHKNGVIVKALTDINLKLEDGDRLGLVGHNGSGKSTLLKVFSGIYEPVSGRIAVNGRVTPLFDMMPGMDVDDTGYENIMTSGLLLGMSREEILQKIPEIEEVSELGDYLRLPVRTYSAGMTTRLGFALVTALDPDVLVLDEGFGAADLRFTQRTAERVDELIGRSRAMVLATHSDAMMESICNKAALMKEGRLLHIGPVAEILSEYQAMTRGPRASVNGAAIEEDGEPDSIGDALEPQGLADRTYSGDERRDASSKPLSFREDREGSGAIRFYDIVARFNDDSTHDNYSSLSLLVSVINTTLHEIDGIDIAIGIDDENSNRVKTLSISQISGKTLSVGIGAGRIYLKCSDISGLSGEYYITLFARKDDDILDWVRYAGGFYVAPHGESKEPSFSDSWHCTFSSPSENTIRFTEAEFDNETRKAS